MTHSYLAVALHYLRFVFTHQQLMFTDNNILVFTPSIYGSTAGVKGHNKLW